MDVRAHFSAAELRELALIPERRLRDRIAGRLAAKAALTAHFQEEDGWTPDPAELEIFNDEKGLPSLRLPQEAGAAAPSFSIAHGPAGAVCAVAAPGRRVGVDLEPVAARPAAVLEFVCGSAERAARPTPDAESQTRVWTGKEALLKLLGLGLDADARDVRVDGDEPAWSGRPARAWRALGAPRVRVRWESDGDALIAIAYTGD